MKVSDLLESRRANWKMLEELCSHLESRGRRQIDAPTVSRFASLYRSACADLALADAYQLPRATVRYLDHLVGRAHNQLYRSRLFKFSTWTHEILVTAPRRLFHDGALRLAFCIFWGAFLISGALAYARPGFADRIAGKEMLASMEDSYSRPVDENPALRGSMMGGYIANNAGIGLQCFALGFLFGVGGLFITIHNAALMGCIFGHMATTPQSTNFYEFVTAHGPYELTAIVMAAGAGMKMGFALLDTKGRTRMASLRQAAMEAMPTMGAFVVLFVLAALIEAFISPTSLPYPVKAGVCIFSIATLLFYFVALGYPRSVRPGDLSAEREGVHATG